MANHRHRFELVERDKARAIEADNITRCVRCGHHVARFSEWRNLCVRCMRRLRAEIADDD